MAEDDNSIDPFNFLDKCNLTKRIVDPNTQDEQCPIQRQIE